MTGAVEQAARPRRRRWRWLLVVALLLLVLLGALAGGAGWLLGTTPGAAWLLARVPGVQAEGVGGSLLGPAFKVDRLVLRWAPDAAATVEGFETTGLVWSWRPAPGAWIGLRAARLGAARISVATGPPATATPPPVLPTSLRLPLQLDIEALQVGELKVDAQPPVRQLTMRLKLGAEHRIDDLGLDWDQLRISGGRVRIAADAPFALQGTLAVASNGSGTLPWQAALRSDGTLERLTLAATLRGPATAGQAAPSLDLKSELAPFRAWPLLALNASTEALDLRSLLGTLPQTQLGGRVDVQSSGTEAPIGVTLTLKNALAGRWDAGRLPLSAATLTLSADLRRRDRLVLPAFDLALGDGGRWRGSAEWDGKVLSLRTQLEALQPQRLHGAAPATQLSGPLAITLRGMPSPADAEPRFDLEALRVDLVGQLDGRLEGAPHPVRLEIDASGGIEQLDLRKLRASAGPASAQLQLNASREAGGGWRLQGEAELERFDPLPWWPGTDAAPWRRGPHRFSASGRFALQLPAEAATLAPLALAPRVAGTARLQVRDSLLAGVPLGASFDLGADGIASTPGKLRAEAVLGGNRFSVDGRVDPFGAGAADRLQVEVDAPDIGTLAPLARLLPGLASTLPRRGRVELRADAEGRWPTLRTSGVVRAGNLQLGDIALGRLQTDWKLATGTAPTLSLQAELDALRTGKQVIDRLRADVQGTPAQHRLQLSAALPVTMPPALGQLLGLPTATTPPPVRGATGAAATGAPGAAATARAPAPPTPRAAAPAGTLAELVADGRWSAAPGGGSSWQVEATRLVVRADDATPPAGVPAWLDASGLRAALRFGADGALQSAQAEPGRARLAGAFALAWQQVELDATRALPALTLRAAIEPFAVAPLLVRAQPTMGWGGDLQLKASIDVRAFERFDADLVVERAGGDLHVGENGSRLQLGLSDLRLGLAAHDGIWTVTQAMAGRTLGEMAGALRARTTPEQRWPPADAPLDGVVEARVANLGIWGTWVPPGWRLAGALRTSATVAGTFGAPEYSGEVRGSGIGVRNALQGVDVHDGEVAITLKGETATIETFRLRGGDGTLEIAGGASFGNKPAAQLRLQARQLRVLGRIDRRVVASGDAVMSLTADLLQLDGSLKVDEGLFDISRADAPALDDDVVVRRTGVQKAAVADTGTASRRQLRVAVDVDLGEKLRIFGRGLDSTLRGKLRITTPGGRLAINGSVRTDRGTYAAYGQKLVIERGIITFNGPPDTPVLDVLALRKSQDSRVGVAVGGPVMSPRVRLYSEPDMSETDKLSWLLLGRASSGLGRDDTALLQSAALGLLSGEGEGKSDALLRQLGIDEFSVRQSDGEVRETVIAIGKQISDRLYVGYERGVNATTGTWQLIYRVAQRFTLRAQSGQDSAVDLIWTWRVK